MKKTPSFKRRLEKLEDRRVLAASIVEFNDVGYFFDSSSPVVARYDIAQSTWLAPITLQNATTGPLNRSCRCQRDLRRLWPNGLPLQQLRD